MQTPSSLMRVYEDLKARLKGVQEACQCQGFKFAQAVVLQPSKPRGKPAMHMTGAHVAVRPRSRDKDLSGVSSWCC